MANKIYTAALVFLGWLAAMVGGWDSSFITLIIFMAVDFVSGLILAAVFHRSTKSENGALESHAGFKGLIRKGEILLVVLVAHRMDLAAGTTIIRDTVVIAFCTNELLSIVENAGQMGVPIPAIITNSIEILRKKGETTLTATAAEEKKEE